MRRTRLGAILLSLGAVSFPFALLLRSAALAIFGALLLALVLAQRPPTVDLRATRAVPDRATAGEPFDVVAEVEDARGANVLLEDEAPAGLRVLSTRIERSAGRCAIHRRVVADGPGLLVWTSLRARFQDGWGVSEDEMRIGVSSIVQVAPRDDALHQGRKIGAKLRSTVRQRSPRGHDREPEIERLREFQPGDRLRDVAWAQTSKIGKLVTRELRRETVLPLVILLDATASMRRAGRHSRLATASDAALSVVAAAQARGIATGFVAWSENGVEAQVRATSGRRAVADAVHAVSKLPPSLARVEARPPARASPLRPLLAEERAFLAAASVFTGAGAVTPVEAALAAMTRVASQPSIVVAILDGETRPELAATVLARSKARGHRLVLVCPAAGPHTYARREVDPAALADLLAWRAARRECEQAARRHHATFVSLPPSLSDATMTEVVRSTA